MSDHHSQSFILTSNNDEHEANPDDFFDLIVPLDF